MNKLFPIRKYDQSTNPQILAIRDGLVFALFMRADHHVVAPSVGSLFEEYLKLIGASTLRWIHDRGDGYRPLTSRKLKSVQSKLSKTNAVAGKRYRFTVKGEEEESTVPGHLFRYVGHDQRLLPRASEWAYTSLVEIWFPTEFPDEIGWDVFITGLLSMASLVPFSSGYASLAVNYEEWAEVDAERLAKGWARRYPGLDIHANSSTGLDIGDQVRGAYWLTFLGSPCLDALKMDGAMRERLDPKIIVHELPNGIGIQAGARPELGDINRQDRLPLVREVAQLIEPVQYIQTSGIFLFDEVDDFVEWQKRHLL